MTDAVYVGGAGHGLRSLPPGLTREQMLAGWRYDFFGALFGSAAGAWPGGTMWPPVSAHPPADLNVYVGWHEFGIHDDLICCGRGGSVPITRSGIGSTMTGQTPVYDQAGALVTPPTPTWEAYWAPWLAAVDQPTATAQADALRSLIGSYMP